MRSAVIARVALRRGVPRRGAFGVILDDRMSQEMSNSARQSVSCYDKALGLLSLRAHFAGELAAKLRKRGYERDEIDAALLKLEANRFLNEVETARAFVRERLRRGAIGRRRLIADLVKRRASQEAIDIVSAEIPEDDVDAVRSLAERWLVRSTRSPGPKRKAALVRHLAGKGFSQRAIVAVLDSVEGDDSGVEF